MELIKFGHSNIGLTLNACSWAKRRIGVVCAWDFCTNHDKRRYRVEAFVSCLLSSIFYACFIEYHILII